VLDLRLEQAEFEICSFAELHYDALLVPEAPDYHTCSLWLANFLLGITVGLGVGIHAEITEYFDSTLCNCTLLGSH